MAVLLEQAVMEPLSRRPDHLLIVVGFDGSGPAYRALDAATQLISGRSGNVEVVFVAHMPAGAEMSAEAHSETLKGFDEAEHEYAEAVGARLDAIDRRWRFQRRDGVVSRELVAAADQLSRDYGEDATVIIVVGRPTHAYHHVVGSVPVALVRHANYPVVVVP